MEKTSMEVNKNNVAKVNGDMAAFNADIEMAEYRHRVETGALTDEEKEDRAAMLDFLGVSEKDFK